MKQCCHSYHIRGYSDAVDERSCYYQCSKRRTRINEKLSFCMKSLVYVSIARIVIATIGMISLLSLSSISFPTKNWIMMITTTTTTTTTTMTVNAFLYSPILRTTRTNLATTNINLLRRKMHSTFHNSHMIRKSPNQDQQQSQQFCFSLLSHTESRSLFCAVERTTRRATSTTKRTTTLMTSRSVEGDFDPEAIERSKKLIQSGSFTARINALYKFTRPHTIRGTILGSIAGTVRALLDIASTKSGGTVAGILATLASLQWATLLPRAVIGMIALLFGNAFIVGINQIYDKDIDVLNKPFLPVASGELSNRSAWIAVCVSAVIGPLLVYQYFPTLLFRLYCTGLMLGFLYSVPPIRTKRNPVLAAMTIAFVRGFLLNFGVYYAVQHALSTFSTVATSSVVSFVWSSKVAFIARFMTVFATIIAVTKDLPDVEGDKAYKIETFATKIGVGKMAIGAAGCLLLNYVHAFVTYILSPSRSFRAVPMIGGHLALAGLLLYRLRQLQPDSLASIKLYYKQIWDLFYLEYILYMLL